MRQLRIVLAEEQSQVVHFLRMFPELNHNVVGAVQDERDLVNAGKTLKPHMVIMDIDLPRLNAIEAVHHLHKIVPNCCVILRGSRGDANFMVDAYIAGASIYLVKGASPSLRTAIQAVFDQPAGTKEWKAARSHHAGVPYQGLTKQDEFCMKDGRIGSRLQA